MNKSYEPPPTLYPVQTASGPGPNCPLPSRLRRWKFGGELGGPVDAKAYSSFLPGVPRGPGADLKDPPGSDSEWHPVLRGTGGDGSREEQDLGGGPGGGESL